jgi:REP element-mobilizing transposase RayT
MPTGYQIKDQSACYYLTFQVVYWIDLFMKQVYRDIVIDSLKYCQKEKGLEIFAWVIMSNHVHILAKSSQGDLSGTIRDFKKFTSKRFLEAIVSTNDSRKEWMIRLFLHAAKRQNKQGEYQVWTHENHAVEVYGNSFIQTKVRYIHDNPVRAGVVRNPEDYKYSSAGAYSGQESMIDIIPIVITIEKIR